MSARVLAFLSLLLAVPTVAAAGPILVHVGSENPGSPYATIYAQGTLADGLQVMVGSVRFTGDLGTFDAYCVDINHYLTPDHWYDVSSVDAMSNWGLSDPVVRAASSPSDAGARAAVLFNTFGGATDSLTRWALQVAIWNALYDTDTDVATGAFRISTGYAAGVARADDLLQALAGWDGSSVDAGWIRLADGPGNGTQDFIAAPVPEPATGWLMGAGLSALLGSVALVRRRRRARGPDISQGPDRETESKSRLGGLRRSFAAGPAGQDACAHGPTASLSP